MYIVGKGFATGGSVRGGDGRGSVRGGGGRGIGKRWGGGLVRSGGRMGRVW